MKCAKCGIEVDDEEVMVLKRGQYENKPLCKKCHEKELQVILGETNELS